MGGFVANYFRESTGKTLTFADSICILEPMTTNGTVKYTPAMVKQAFCPSECGCCGRSELKKTVPVRPVAGGDVVWMGTGCAARACGVGVPEFRRQVEALEKTERDAAARIQNAEQVRWEAWVMAKTGRRLVDAFDAIQALGGMASVRAQYREEVTRG